MKNRWLKRYLSGMAVGLASSIPGVSGGTIMVILKMYEGIVWAFSHLFKEFKKAFTYLLPILLGALTAAIPMLFVMKYALEGFLFGAVCIFAGFIIGSLPSITDEIRHEKIKKHYIVICIITAIVALGIACASVFAKADVSDLFEEPKWWFYLVLIPVGLLASAALVVPGVSGGMVLILVGFYKPLITSTSEVLIDAFHGNFEHFFPQLGMLCCLAVGVIAGFFLITMVMNILLKQFRTATFYGILGFVIGSTIALFFNYEIYAYYEKWANGEYSFIPMAAEIPIGIVLLIGACIGAYFLMKAQRKNLKDIHSEEVKSED